MIRLYRAPWSTNVERVALALAHKGLEAESVWISYDDRRPVEAVSGQGLVPVIEHDGRVVADSMEIVRHLEEHFPDPPLYPAGPARRAEMLVFVDWFNRVWKVAPNAIEAEHAGAEPSAERIEQHSRQMRVHLDLFESLLDGRPYLMGEEMSAADVCAYPFLKYVRGRDPADDEAFHRILEEHQPADGHPRVAAWIERMMRKPSM